MSHTPKFSFRKALFVAIGLMAIPMPAIAGKAKVPVCHETGSGSVNQLQVASPALSAHVNHGDWTPDEYFADADGDGFGDANVSSVACVAPAGFVTNSDDFDDTNPNILNSEYQEYQDATVEEEGEFDEEEGEY